MSTLLGNYVTPVPAQQRLGPRWFAGSADAIYQSLNLINDEQPDYVIVFGADHIYRMDPSQMVAAHIESGAGVTVAAIRQPLSLADQFGVIEVANDRAADRGVPGEADRRRRPGRRRRTRSTPRWATTSSRPTRCSTRCGATPMDPASKHDMGGNIIPMLVERGEAHVYDFRDNDVPGQHRPRPRLLARRRDAGLVLRGAHGPHRDPPGVQPLQLRLADLHRARPAAAGQVRARLQEGRSGRAIGSMVSRGAVVSGALVESSVRLAVDERALVGAGGRLGADGGRRHRPARRGPQRDPRQERGRPGGRQIGVDLDADRASGFTVSDGGIVVVGKGQRVAL